MEYYDSEYLLAQGQDDLQSCVHEEVTLNLKPEGLKKKQPIRCEERGGSRNSICKGPEAERWEHVKESERKTLWELKQSEGKE